MQVITGSIQEEAVLIYEPSETLLVIRDGLQVTDQVARRLSEILSACV